MATLFVITEKLTINSVRNNGVQVEAESLAAAKRWATKNQMFKGTVMEIRDQNGTILSWKGKNGKWIDL